MKREYDLSKIVEKIYALQKNAEELKQISEGIPAVEKNVDRILTSIKMLEINITDITRIP